MPERRIFARHTPNALTYVSAGDNNGGILLNVSEAGCALQLVSPPPTLSDVSLDLDLGSTLPRIEVAGKVIWADETGCTGIRFAHLTDVARQTIRRFVENNPADPALPEIGVELEQEIGAGSSPALESEVEHLGRHEDAAGAAEAEPEEALFDSVESKPFEQQLHELSTGAAFVALVEECRSATGATSAALALLKGREMLCRASCGKGAPPSGARLDITSERSFTAQCVSTGTTLRCVDSQIDPRVNAAVCQRLGIRSVTAMPLMHKEHVVGVLEVFSSERDAFDDSHITALERLGKLAVEFALARNEVTVPSSQAPAPSWPASVKPAAPRAPERPQVPAVATPAKPPAFNAGFSTAAAVAVAPAMAPSTTA
ncbi:MAG TPA: GAF domain-containing protein, partial [Terriglobales bacterium]|nr:GAF domain-containing protein [Terriglobales bacterium]